MQLKKFNGLNGIVDKEIIQQLADLAIEEGQTHLYNRLKTALEKAEAQNVSKFNPGQLALEQVSTHDLPGIDPIPSYISVEDYTGLNKAVSPDDIYQYITD